MKFISIPSQLTVILIFSMFIISCNSNSNKVEEKESAKEEVKSSKKIGLTKCDKIINDYDDLVEKSIEMAMKAMDGEEIDKAEEASIKEEGEKLAKRIQTLGVTGLGGAECWQEFVDVQMKWTEASMELQKKAIEKAQEAMKEYQNNN